MEEQAKKNRNYKLKKCGKLVGRPTMEALKALYDTLKKKPILAVMEKFLTLDIFNPYPKP